MGVSLRGTVSTLCFHGMPYLRRCLSSRPQHPEDYAKHPAMFLGQVGRRSSHIPSGCRPGCLYRGDFWRETSLRAARRFPQPARRRRCCRWCTTMVDALYTARECYSGQVSTDDNEADGCAAQYYHDTMQVGVEKRSARRLFLVAPSSI